MGFGRPMSLEALFISGPARAGKTTAARLLKEQVVGRPLHYLRMRRSKDGHSNMITAFEPADRALDPDWASCHLVTYTEERVFETLPEALRTVRRLDPHPFLVIEADADACLRHAYPYDFRVFVMSTPRRMQDVFRDSRDAAVALQQVMQDTSAFAS